MFGLGSRGPAVCGNAAASAVANRHPVGISEEIFLGLVVPRYVREMGSYLTILFLEGVRMSTLQNVV